MGRREGVVAGNGFWPAAAKVLTSLLDKLHSASARGRRGNLALVKSMTTTGNSARICEP
jgi:hypothetical protein